VKLIGSLIFLWVRKPVMLIHLYFGVNLLSKHHIVSVVACIIFPQYSDVEVLTSSTSECNFHTLDYNPIVLCLVAETVLGLFIRSMFIWHLCHKILHYSFCCFIFQHFLQSYNQGHLTVLENKIWSLGVVIPTRVLLLPGPLTQQNKVKYCWIIRTKKWKWRDWPNICL
jgi:hypothetical protein